MAIQYVDDTRIHQTFSAATKTEMLSNLFSYLQLAGFSLVSGCAPVTATISLATPGVVTLDSGLAPAAGSRIVFTTTGALPTGLTAGSLYYVRNPVGASFNVSTVATGGSLINTSGSQSGTHTLNIEFLLQTATTPAGHDCRFRIRDNGVATVAISLESTDGTKVGSNDASHGANLLPASGKTWHLVANKYQFAIFVEGDYATPSESCLGCVPYVPPFMAASVTAVGLLVAGDSTSYAGHWRHRIDANPNNYNVNMDQHFYNGYMINYGVNQSIGNTTQGAIRLQQDSVVGVWGNGDLVTVDPLVAWSSTGWNGSDWAWRCQLWDSIIICDSFLGDTQAAFDRHNWMCFTSSRTSNTGAALWLAIP